LRCRRRRLCLCLSWMNNHINFRESVSLPCFVLQVKNMTDKKGLYIHIPFCVRKCNYCSFTSFDGKYGDAAGYFEKIMAEIDTHKKYEVDTIYFGGGTPSSVDSDFICRTLEKVYTHFKVSDGAEITIEVNPDSVETDKLSTYKKIGINRISMGAQSFDCHELELLGRLHTADEIIKKYSLIRSAGFDNISLDLMFGLPGQTEEKLCASIDSILKLHPEHISCYGLKIEEGTPFYNAFERGELLPLDDDYFADLYDYMCKRITDAGYIQYEISNFSVPGRQSRHNSKYWQCEEYIGIGTSAASYLNGIRSRNTDSVFEYKNVVEEKLSLADKMSEFVIFGLRLTEKGISISEFRNRFGRDIYDVFSKQLKKHERFITRDGDVLKLTREAYYVSNAVFADFIGPF